MEKFALRRLGKQKRKSLSEADYIEKSAIITQKLIDLIDWNCTKTISCYQARKLWNEVETEAFIDYARLNHPTIRIDLVDQSAKIPLPVRIYDCIIVPVVAFDSKGNRIGMGQGWYDTFLASQKTTQKIGLAFDCQKMPLLPCEPHDQQVMIVTESGNFS